MKDLNQYIQNINEAREAEYTVCFVDGPKDDGLPISVKILVPRSYVRAFENFLDNEQDNIFIHAEGGSIEY